MSTCIEYLCDYNSVEKYTNYGSTPLKSNFHKDRKRNGGFLSERMFCRKVYGRKYFEEKSDLEINKQRKHKSELQEKIKKYRCDNRDKLKESCLKKILIPKRCVNCDQEHQWHSKTRNLEK